MKNKLRKLTIDKLSESLTACSSSEMSQFIGGGYYFFFYKDGKLSKSEEFAGDGNFVFANGNSMEVGDTFNVTETPASENQREGLSITGGNLDVFKFLADNTDIEWAASYNPGADAFITTNHSENSVDHPLTKGYEYQIHSHPYNDEPSLEDYGYGVAALRGTERGSYDYKTVEIYRPKSADNKEGKIIDYTLDAKKWK